jgi:hypothetical protein
MLTLAFLEFWWSGSKWYHPWGWVCPRARSKTWVPSLLFSQHGFLNKRRLALEPKFQVMLVHNWLKASIYLSGPIFNKYYNMLED